jgi:hypothetical protein
MNAHWPSGMKRSNTVPESEAIESRDIVRGSKAIWKKGWQISNRRPTEVRFGLPVLAMDGVNDSYLIIA